MEVVSLAAESPTAWETVVERSPTATPFHTLAWKRTVEASFGYPPRYTLVEQDGKVVGGLPAFETPNTVGSDITNPFCEYGYPILIMDVDDVSMLRSLTGSAGRFDAVIVKEAVQSRVSGYSDAGYGGVSTGVTFRLALDRSYAAIRDDAYDVEARRNVRLARESGIEVSTTSSLDDYYPLYVQTMERLGSPQFPRSFFESLLSEFGDDCCWVLVARSNNEAVGGIVVVRGANETAIISNASDPRFWEQSPNHLLYATAIENAVDRGDEVVDFGRTSIESGVYRFKKQFGGRERPLMSMVAPAHRIGRASVEQYRRLEPIVERLGPLITNAYVGPCLKKYIHE